MLTILAALNDEIRLIKAELEIDKAIHIQPFSIYIGTYCNQKIAICSTGAGQKAMSLAIGYCLEQLKPDIFMNIGYAGGIDPRLHNGDIVIANKIVRDSTGSSWTISKELVDRAKRACDLSELRQHIGTVVTVDKPLVTPHDKAFVGTKFEAIACDMESASLPNPLNKAGKPFLVVRSILDSLDTELPDIPEEAVIGGKVQIGAIIGHLKSNPKDILKLPKFSYLCNQARIALTNFVKEWVRHEKEA